MKKGIHEVIERLDQEPEISIHDETCAVRNWLLETDESPKIDQDQIQAFDNAISDRMRGFVTAEQFIGILAMEQSKSGVGLSIHHAKLLSERLEGFLSDEYEDGTLKATEKK